MIKTLELEESTVLIETMPGDKRRVTVVPHDRDQYMFQNEWVTSYPEDLICLIANVTGTAGICHEMMRDEDPAYVERLLRNDLSAYLDLADINGKRILDFGCGSGASTMILARLFPDSEIVGVELLESSLSIARKRAEYYGFANVRFLQSPGETMLPPEIGEFDLVVMSAVYEHLLPDERERILPQLWSAICGGGHLFIDQTPHRWFPFELHTTAFPLINYLPDGLAFAAARRFSKRLSPGLSWEEMLREGIRGATESEIARFIPQDDSVAVMLEPVRGGLRDRIDLYYLNTNPDRHRTLKRIARTGIKALRSVTGVTLVPDLSLAFRKENRD